MIKHSNSFLDEGQTHLHELSALAQKDPEFYKYLQENDRELLDFDPGQDGAEVDSEGEDDGGFDMDGVEGDDGEDDRLPPLTMGILKGWQKALLEVRRQLFFSPSSNTDFKFLQQRSLRALRKLLIAFRSAAHMNEDGQILAWSIDSSSGKTSHLISHFDSSFGPECVVYNKLVTTTFKYTPIVLEHHIPYKTLPNGKLYVFFLLHSLLYLSTTDFILLVYSKPPTQTPKQKTLQKLLLSYFHNIIHIFSQLTENDMIQLALEESAKIVPYVIGSRKAVRAYLKVCKCEANCRCVADAMCHNLGMSRVMGERR